MPLDPNDPRNFAKLEQIAEERSPVRRRELEAAFGGHHRTHEGSIEAAEVARTARHQALDEAIAELSPLIDRFERGGPILGDVAIQHAIHLLHRLRAKEPTP